jgi:malate dehydrogenase (oxaloacetate-decarboxylating)(NADP+)
VRASTGGTVRSLAPGQGNNVYIFPAIGMAVFATEAICVTDEMFIVAARAVAEQVTDDNLVTGLIYPPQNQILQVCLHVAARAYRPVYSDSIC